MKAIAPLIHMCHDHLVGVLVFLILSATGIFPAENGECSDNVSTLRDNTFLMVTHRPKGSPLRTWVELTYAEVFRRLNIPLKMVERPSKRATVELNSGRMDGDPGRIHSYGALYPNLIRVEEPIFFLTVMAFSADPSLPELNGWESLKNTGYYVEYHRGMVICENNLSKMVRPERLSTSSKSIHGLRKLIKNRIDFYVDDMNAIIPILQDKMYNLQGKIHVAGIMERVPVYMYVHKKHRSLVPKLAKVIRTVTSEGLIEQYRKIAFDIGID